MNKGFIGLISLFTASTVAYIVGIKIGKIYYTEVKEYEELVKIINNIES